MLCYLYIHFYAAFGPNLSILMCISHFDDRCGLIYGWMSFYEPYCHEDIDRGPQPPWEMIGLEKH